MQKELVSVIIPSYNAEAYIAECMDSLLHQTYSNLEIICVDDGSTDNTYRILEAYQAKDARVKLFRQHNQYAGVARNRGIMESRGKYLLFVDSDDFCQTDMIEILVKEAEIRKPDILVFDLYKFDNKSKEILKDSWTTLHPELFGEGVKAAVDLKDTIFQFTSSGPMNKLFLRDFIIQNNIRFQPIPRTNDLFFIYASLTYADRIAILEKKLEYYRFNNSYSLQATNHKSPLAFLEALRALKDNLAERKVYELYEESFKKLVIATSLFNLGAQKRKETYTQVIHAIKDTIVAEMGINLKELDSNMQSQRIERAIRQGSRLVIYGAGTLSEVLVKYLVEIREIDKSMIKIAVTKRSNSLSALCGIEIVEVSDLLIQDYLSTFIVAINDKKVQNEIMEKLSLQGVENVIAVGFEEMLALITA